MKEFANELFEGEVNNSEEIITEEVNFAEDAEEVTFDQTPAKKTVKVKSAKLNLRRFPKIGELIVTTLGEGTELKVDETFSNPEWTKVSTLDGRYEGFVVSDFVE